jgi:tetratricopeptide (TPR) repeat protein
MRFPFINRVVKKLVSIACLCILIQIQCFPENKQKMDSLKMALQFEKEDTSKLNIYINLLNECDQKNNLYYGNLLIDFVDKKIFLQSDKKIKKNFKNARINALLSVNGAFDRKKDSIPHFTYLSKKQQYYLSKKDIEGYVHVTKILANEFRVAGDILKSVQQYKAALIVVKKHNYKIGEGLLLDGLTKNFLIIGDTVEALLNLNKAIAVYVQEGDSLEQAAGYRMLGAIYGLKGKALYAKSAINYFEKSKKINSLIKNDEGYFLSLNGLANLYTKYAEYGLALNTYNQALSFASEKSMKYEVALIYQNIGVIYLNQKNIDLARSNINAALEIANEFKIEDRIVFGKKYLSDTYFIEKKFAIAKKLMTEAAEENKIHGDEETKREFELRLYRIDSAANNS